MTDNRIEQVAAAYVAWDRPDLTEPSEMKNDHLAMARQKAAAFIAMLDAAMAPIVEPVVVPVAEPVVMPDPAPPVEMPAETEMVEPVSPSNPSQD